MPEEDNNFWTEVFQRELRDAEDPAAMMAMGGRGGKPGVLLFRGWGLESRIGGEAQTQMAAVRTDIEEARKKLEPAYPFVHGVKDVEKPVEPAARDPRQPGKSRRPEVPRHFLSMLSKDEPPPFSKGSGRLELAEDILKQPIAMRVIVNRIWKGHFGTGIVDTPSNFGVTGERPTNPELLEYLAGSFVEERHVHQEAASRNHAERGLPARRRENDAMAAAKDSGNRLYWRFNRKRMEAEQLRDSVLSVAGNLDKSLGGPSVDLTPAFTRRTVYGKVSRYKLDEYLQLFDFPAPEYQRREALHHHRPAAAPVPHEQRLHAGRGGGAGQAVAGEPDNRSRIKKAYQLIYGRDPERGGDQSRRSSICMPSRCGNTKRTRTNRPRAARRSWWPRRRRRPRHGRRCQRCETAAAPKPEGEPARAPQPAAPMGMGMMGGMSSAAPGGADAAVRTRVPAPVKYEPTAWGRYLKVLFSSSEFLFIN